MLPEVAGSDLFSACQVLFGRKTLYSSSFLAGLRPDSLKSTFREKAFLTHPDRAAVLGRDPVRMEKEFHRVVAAYKVLAGHIMKRPPARARSAPSRQDPPAPPREKKAPPRRGRTAPSSGSRTRPPSGNTRPAHGPGRASAADAAPRQAAAARPLSRTWKGPLPGRRLKFGQFLFFSGVIPARDLLDALSWQRSQRPAFGQIAREWGILDARQVAHVLVRKLPAEAFGECAARLGYMSPFEKHAVACRQKNLQRPLGRFFLDRGILDAAAMNNALLLQRAHNQAFLR